MKVTVLMKYVFCLMLCLLPTSSNVGAAPAVFDFDGDGKTDPVVIRQPPNGNLSWFVLQSRDGFSATVWGLTTTSESGDSTNILGDYDGDGKWDIAVARRTPSASPNIIWYILNSRDNTMTALPWGKSDDLAVPQDYDGDGRADIAVYRYGWWYILRSSDNQLYAEQFGSPGDNPLRGGDYDGDRKADLAVVRWHPRTSPGGPVPTSLYLRRSSDGTWAGYNLGDARATGVLTGDYDGDRKADVAIWQGNLWLWIRSSDNQPEGVRFGLGAASFQDYPVPGDYDGDGKTDPAVFRQSFPQRYFYLLQSQDGFKAVPWGGNLDGAPASLDYIPAVGF